MKKILIVNLIIIFGLLQAVFGADSSSSFPIMNLLGSTRAEAMSGAYCALADDATGVYYNPAGLNRLNGWQVSISDLEWIGDIRVNAIDYLHRFSFGIIGINVGYLGSKGFSEIDTTGSSTSSDLSISEFESCRCS